MVTKGMPLIQLFGDNTRRRDAEFANCIAVTCSLKFEIFL